MDISRGLGQCSETASWQRSPIRSVVECELAIVRVLRIWAFVDVLGLVSRETHLR